MKLVCLGILASGLLAGCGQPADRTPPVSEIESRQTEGAKTASAANPAVKDWEGETGGK